ncbi:MAG: hypothetical protein FJ125_02165 [Deltaproteobacteria bacterium]|nr:hypothetical protein [Deltaproteobacteria bacterium]
MPEQCNGLDDDCDGSVDEELAAPPCALQQGVCAGATQRCGGATGWLACTPESYGPRWVANETFLFCDGLDNDCDGQFDEECGRPAVLLNEVLYDDPGEDGDCVFVELWGEPLTPLSGVVLQGVDGATGQVYASIDLSGERIQHDGYFLVVDELASPALRQLANMVSPLADLQNGPDSVRLLWNERLVLDALGYGTFAQPEHFAGEGRPAPDVEPGSHAQGVSLTRDEAHTDTGDNAADFSSSATSIPPLPTPRGQPLARILVVLTWSNEEDLDLHLLRPGRGLRSEDDCHFGQDHLDWGEPGEALDDPLLDHDAPSFGPERIFLPEPGEERYLVVVHHYTPQQSSEARLQVFVDGVNTSVRTRLLPADGRDYWTVARLEVGENGGIAVVTVDELVRAAPAFP